jgi:hypothetical protein
MRKSRAKARLFYFHAGAQLKAALEQRTVPPEKVRMK